MTPTPSPDPGRCPECGCGWWEPHRTGCSEPRFLTPDPAAAGEGTERPDTAALLTIGDWLLRTLPGHQGAEQTAAALAHTARWIDAQPPVPPSPAPQADGLAAIADDLAEVTEARRTYEGNFGTMSRAGSFVGRMPSERYEVAIARILTAVRTHLAAAPSAPVERPQPEPGTLVLDPDDRFHLWAKLYGIQQEAGLCRFGGRNYDPRLDHIYEEVTTALAYFEPPAPTDGEP